MFAFYWDIYLHQNYKRMVMSKGKGKRLFYYRQTYGGQNYNIKDYWCLGDAFIEGDEELLKEVKEYYRKNNYSPSRGDLPIEMAYRLKGRFRTWKNVLLAAGVPELNSAETQRKRKEAAKKKKKEHEWKENDSKD